MLTTSSFKKQLSRLSGGINTDVFCNSFVLIPFHSDHDMNLGGSLCIVIPAKARIHSSLVSYNTPTLLRIGITKCSLPSRSEISKTFFISEAAGSYQK